MLDPGLHDDHAHHIQRAVWFVMLVVGSFAVIFGLFSYVIKQRLLVSEVICAICFGFALGPYGFGFVNLWNEFTDPYLVTVEFARVLLSIQLIAAGMFLPPYVFGTFASGMTLERHRKYIWNKLGDVMILLFPVMLIEWFSTAGIVKFFLREISFVTETLLRT